MIFFIRDSRKSGNNIVDLQYYKATSQNGKYKYLQIKTSIDIKAYSTKLLNFPSSQDELKYQFIEDIARIEYIRGWLNEVYYMGRGGQYINDNINEDYDKVFNILRESLTAVAKKYDLYYCQD